MIYVARIIVDFGKMLLWLIIFKYYLNSNVFFALAQDYLDNGYILVHKMIRLFYYHILQYNPFCNCKQLYSEVFSEQVGMKFEMAPNPSLLVPVDCLVTFELGYKCW